MLRCTCYHAGDSLRVAFLICTMGEDNVSKAATQSESDPISQEFCTALRRFILNLTKQNGGYGKVQIEIVAGEIRRIEGAYQLSITEPYLMSAV